VVDGKVEQSIPIIPIRAFFVIEKLPRNAGIKDKIAETDVRLIQSALKICKGTRPINHPN
jgi:hypothetical protein